MIAMQATIDNANNVVAQGYFTAYQAEKVSQIAAENNALLSK